MGTDRSIQRALEGGQRNANGLTLVKNWCAHVRVERFGGVGMVEQATGLPIGHHGLACDHAPAGGMMCWDIRDAALDFYDRNCHDCTLRKAVGLPNLGSWVAERDAEVAKRQAAEDAEASEIAARLAERQTERAALRAGLPPAAADVVDQIEELDLQRTPELTARLAETARLAPEAFPLAVVEHAFGLLEAQEHWFDEAGLQVLAALSADPRRLARSAMICLQRWSATRTAVRVLLARLSVADETLIPAVLPAVIRMASPSREFFARQEPRRIATLVRLNAAFPQQVAAALDDLFDRGPPNVSLAACAVEGLAWRDPALAVRFARDLISKLVRATWLPDPDDHGDDDNGSVAHDLRDAIVAAFLRDPDAVHALLQSFRAGASEAGELRIFSVYSRVLHAGRFRKARAAVAADRLAFRHLLWEAPKTKSDRVLREIHGAINQRPYDLVDLARDEIDALLGAAILMDERVVAFDAEPKAANAMTLGVIERNNRRGTLTSLRSSFVSWAAAGAAAGGKPASYLQVLEGLPEDRDEFAACMIENSVALMDTAAGLNAVLPALYSALVGMSVARRGSAVRAIGEMPWRQRENAPDLLFEAFVTTLTDPYIYVHRSAVMALGRLRLPATFDARVRNGLTNVLLAHKKDPHREDIVLECIELLAGRYLTAKERSGRAGAFLVTLLAKMPAWRLSSNIGIFARQLAHARGLVDLLVAHLLDPATTESGEERALEALADLPVDVVYAHRGKLAEIPMGTDRRARYRVLDVLQILARSRAWAEGEQLAAAAVAAIPDTVREASQRLMFELAHAAAAFEHALARGDNDCAATLATRWRELNAAKEANDRERAQRPDPLRHLRGATGGV
jgi:hypothetical protein